MKCIVIGDIGRSRLYHVGDEAMTEVAIEMLQARGFDEVTLAAIDPPSASAHYGLPAIPQIRYSGKATRTELKRQLELCTSESTIASSRAGVLDHAIRSANAVVIAGGGNMNSLYRHHLYERATAARLARRHAVPLIVSSQTVGPHLDDHDEALVAEIAADALLFGVRDPNSLDVIRRLAPHPDRVVLTSDDALLLPRSDAEAETLPARFIAASFAASTETSGFDPASYPDRVASLCDELAAAADADVLLVPHAGSLNPATPTKEQSVDRAVAESSATGRVRAVPPQTARRIVDVTARSILSVSTRYHPTVFAPAHGVPAVGAALSHYSTVRMRGSLGAVGLDDFLVTAPAWSQIVPAGLEAISRSDELRHHLEAAHRDRAREQEQWWDAAVQAVTGGSPSLPARSDVPEVSATGSWRGAADSAGEGFDSSAPEREVVRCLRRDLDVVESKLAAAQKRSRALSARAQSARQRAEAAESRKVVRAADRVGAAARRLLWRRRR